MSPSDNDMPDWCGNSSDLKLNNFNFLDLSCPPFQDSNDPIFPDADEGRFLRPNVPSLPDLSEARFPHLMTRPGQPNPHSVYSHESSSSNFASRDHSDAFVQQLSGPSSYESFRTCPPTQTQTTHDQAFTEYQMPVPQVEQQYIAQPEPRCLFDGQITLVCALWQWFHPIGQHSQQVLRILCAFFDIQDTAAANDIFSRLTPSNESALSQDLPPGWDMHFLTTLLYVWRLMNPVGELHRTKAEQIAKLLRLSVQEVESRLPSLGSEARWVENPEKIVRKIIKRFRRNQNQCLSGAARPDISRQDASGRYQCTNRCGARFSRKAVWKLHEEKNWRQRFWCCRLEGCYPGNPVKRFKGTLRNLKDHHATVHKNFVQTEPSIDEQEIPIPSNYPKHCDFFQDCDAHFLTWSDRINHLASEHFEKGQTLPDRADFPSNTDESEEEDDSDDESEPEDGNEFDDEKMGGTGGGNSNQTMGGFGNGGGSSLPGNLDGTSNSGNSDFLNTGGFRYAFAGQSPEGNTGRACEAPIRQFYRSSQLFEKLVRTRQPAATRLISRTSCVTVDRVTYSRPKCTFARKSIYAPSNVARAAQREAEILEALRHPNIVQHLAHFRDKERFYILMYPAAETDLLQFMREASLQDVLQLKSWDWFAALASGLSHIHHHGFRHRDVKPANILVHEGHVLFADFGLSNFVAEDQSDSQQSGYCTKRYAAPELRSGRRGRSSDVWSLGCVFLELLSFLIHTETIGALCILNPREAELGSDWTYANKGKAVNQWVKSLGAAAKHLPIDIRNRASTILSAGELMMRIDPRSRPNAKELTEVLRFSAPTYIDIDSQDSNSVPLALVTVVKSRPSDPQSVPHHIPSLGSEAKNAIAACLTYSDLRRISIKQLSIASGVQSRVLNSTLNMNRLVPTAKQAPDTVVILECDRYRVSHIEAGIPLLDRGSQLHDKCLQCLKTVAPQKMLQLAAKRSQDLVNDMLRSLSPSHSTRDIDQALLWPGRQRLPALVITWKSWLIENFERDPVRAKFESLLFLMALIRCQMVGKLLLRYQNNAKLALPLLADSKEEIKRSEDLDDATDSFRPPGPLDTEKMHPTCVDDLNQTPRASSPSLAPRRESGFSFGPPTRVSTYQTIDSGYGSDDPQNRCSKAPTSGPRVISPRVVGPISMLRRSPLVQRRIMRNISTAQDAEPMISRCTTLVASSSGSLPPPDLTSGPRWTPSFTSSITSVDIDDSPVSRPSQVELPFSMKSEYAHALRQQCNACDEEVGKFHAFKRLLPSRDSMDGGPVGMDRAHEMDKSRRNALGWLRGLFASK